MLEENKKIYKQLADQFVPDWKTVDKNYLIRQAANETDNTMKDAYIAAIMLRYWNKLDSYYYKCKLVITPEEVHTWLTIAVMYAINKKPWENPKMGIYNDETGPDKVINRIIESKRLTFYQQLNRYKRKINSAITSLDSLQDDYKDVFMPTYEDDYNFVYDQYVKDFFNKKDYFMSFMLDAILYDDVITDDKLNNRKLSSYIRNIDDEQCELFAMRYDIPIEDVKYAVQFVTNINGSDMKNKIEYNLIRLQKLLQEGDN